MNDFNIKLKQDFFTINTNRFQNDNIQLSSKLNQTLLKPFVYNSKALLKKLHKKFIT